MNEENTPVEAEEEVAAPTAVVIKAVNPTTEEMASLRESVKANYDFNVDVKATKFNFKKSKDKDTGIETTRESVELALPYPSVEGIIAILEVDDGGKQLELLMDAMADIINAAARDLLQDDTKLNASTFPVEKLSWEAISLIPKTTRRGGGIPKEVWEGFAADYVAIMPAITGKSIEQVTNAARILQNKLAAAKTNEPVLQMLVGQLAIYAENTPNMEDFKECVDFLVEKADAFMNLTPEQLLANL